MPIRVKVFPQYLRTGVELVADWSFRTRARVVPFSIPRPKYCPVFTGRLLLLRQRIAAIRVLKAEVGARKRLTTGSRGRK